jgi:Flp pilus assembly protein CpaB
MRASTIFALIAAVVLGLGAAVGIKYSRILEPKGETTKAPTVTPILVAGTNLYEGTYLQATDVKLRPPRSEEEVRMQRSGELLPPLAQAAVKRIAKTNIPTDAPIRKDMLEDLNRPESLSDRIGPCDRGVHCCLHKQYCAGGLLGPGDIVDVMLTTTVEGPDGSQVLGKTASAVVARGLRIVTRRNSLVPVNTPLGPDCCINYTLSANPYRAALIDYVKNMGILSLHPVSSTEKARYDAEWRRRKEEADAMRLRGDTGIRTTAYTDDKDATRLLSYCATGDQKEDERIAGILYGNYSVGEKDLVELFGLKYIPAEQPPMTSIQKISGVDYVGDHVFGPGVRNLAPRDGQRGNYALGGAGNVSPGGIRTVSGSQGAIADASGNTGVFRFRAPDAACPPGQARTTPVVRRRN